MNKQEKKSTAELRYSMCKGWPSLDFNFHPTICTFFLLSQVLSSKNMEQETAICFPISFFFPFPGVLLCLAVVFTKDQAFNIVQICKKN